LNFGEHRGHVSFSCPLEVYRTNALNATDEVSEIVKSNRNPYNYGGLRISNGRGRKDVRNRFQRFGVDIGKWTSWFLLLAFRESGRIHIPDYGVIEVHSDNLQEEVAILAALREFRASIEGGWPVQGSTDTRKPDAIWIDAGHLPAVIHQFCREAGTFPTGRWFAAIGRGASLMEKQRYYAPHRTNKGIRRVGQGWFLARTNEHHSHQVTFDSDHWKLWLQAGLRAPVDERGAITLFDPGADKLLRDRHNKLSRHFASEQLQQRMEPGKGLVQEWVKHVGAG
jgi:hypothetical protein